MGQENFKPIDFLCRRVERENGNEPNDLQQMDNETRAKSDLNDD